MLEKFKQLIWISTGGLVIGTLIRHGYDAIRGIPDFVDSPILDIGPMLFGGSLALLSIWMILTVTAMVDHRPWIEAKEQWDRFRPCPEGIPRFLFVCLRAAMNLLEYWAIYYFVALLACVALAAMDLVTTCQFFLGWCVVAFAGWVNVIGLQKKWFAEEPSTLRANAVKLLNLPEQPGRLVVGSLFVVFMFGLSQFGNISQSFGGGRPEKVIVFLRSGQPADTSSRIDLEGKVVDLLFRRGMKLGFRTANMVEGQVLVIDQSQVDHLYVGKKIQGLDLSKLK